MRSLVRTALLLSALFATIACGGEDARPQGTGGGAPPVPTASKCVDGQMRECKITVAVREGYVDCIEGKQRCLGGGWAACQSLKELDAGASPEGPLDAGGD
ncbi:MAG: hypothetical protein HYV09_18870 [Deltaproteobacteria bacterium]|nr:hypothetical protein [Deltaproteobacteria bacterium]